jgi:putative tryptophan/tyrosine transport system substrate-binding protein
MLLSRASNGDPSRLAPLLNELVAAKVDILIPVGPAAARASRSATSSIPIVAVDLESDPIESGWLASFAHPGGNLTGFFLDFPEFSTKWLQLLKDTVPGLASVVVLWDPATSAIQSKAIASAAQVLNVKIEIMEIKAPGEIEAVLYAAGQRRPDGLVLLSSPLFSAYSKEIADLTLKHRLPRHWIFLQFSSGRWADVVRTQSGCAVSGTRRHGWEGPERHKARRFASRAAIALRTGGEFEDGKGVQPQHSKFNAVGRRRGD